MGRGLSDLQRGILAAVARLETDCVCVVGLEKVKAKAANRGDVFQDVYGDGKATRAQQAAFSRALRRLKERGLLELLTPNYPWYDGSWRLRIGKLMLTVNSSTSCPTVNR